MQRIRKIGAVTILSAMLTGLGTFLFDHFVTDYPNLKAQVKVLEQKSKSEIEILNKVQEDIREIRRYQIDIYKILVE